MPEPGAAPAALRLWHIDAERIEELPALPPQLPPTGFVWIGIARPALGAQLHGLQQALARWQVGEILDLHVSDLLNAHLPSHFDDTSSYDLLVFRRMAGVTGDGTSRTAGGRAPPAGIAAEETGSAPAADMPTDASDAGAGAGSERDAGVDAGSGRDADAGAPAHVATLQPLLVTVDTSPVGFVVYDRVLVSIHPGDCAVRELFARRLPMTARAELLRSSSGSRLPASPADLMLRMLNVLVDNYLELRRRLGRQMSLLQQDLLDPRGAFADWQVLLHSRDALDALEEICEDQRAAVQEWIDSLEERPPVPGTPQAREFELLLVRSRDVLEHIERVVSHVDRLQRSAESAVQMHFSAIGHRTNDIMRTLTAITAIFLPLNLITGFFGMNFDGLPLIHSRTGVWIAGAMMTVVVLALTGFFVRRRYLGERAQRRLEAGLALLDPRGTGRGG